MDNEHKLYFTMFNNIVHSAHVDQHSQGWLLISSNKSLILTTTTTKNHPTPPHPTNILKSPMKARDSSKSCNCARYVKPSIQADNHISRWSKKSKETPSSKSHGRNHQCLPSIPWSTGKGLIIMLESSNLIFKLMICDIVKTWRWLWGNLGLPFIKLLIWNWSLTYSVIILQPISSWA